PPGPSRRAGDARRRPRSVPTPTRTRARPGTAEIDRARRRRDPRGHTMAMLEGRVGAVTGAGRGIGREIALLLARHGARIAVNDTHLKGTFAVTRAAAPYMKEQKSGRFINMTSTSGLVGNVGQANYAAAKMGIVGLTKIVALDMARYNVTANCISPFAWTRMIGTIPTETEAQKTRVEKIKKMGPEHVAPLAVCLASDEAREVSGQVFGVRGKEIMLFGHMRPI